MRPLLAIQAAALVLLTPVPALAADDLPKLDGTYLRTATGMRTLHQYVECQRNRDPELAQRLFDHPYGSQTQVRLLDQFLDDSNHNAPCLFVATQLQSSHLMFLGSLADQLVKQDTPARPREAGSNEPVPESGSYVWTWRRLNDESRMLPVADCLVSRNYPQTVALLQSRFTSNGERNIFNTMLGDIKACIPAGQTLVVQPQTLRAAMALVLYSAHRETLRSGPAQEAAE